jgi:hypothetical protein
VVVGGGKRNVESLATPTSRNSQEITSTNKRGLERLFVQNAMYGTPRESDLFTPRPTNAGVMPEKGNVASPPPWALFPAR